MLVRSSVGGNCCQAQRSDTIPIMAWGPCMKPHPMPNSALGFCSDTLGPKWLFSLHLLLSKGWV